MTTKDHDPPAEVLDLPVGLHAEGQRTESDSMGEIAVPADRYWGAQTQRSLRHFRIGTERMPIEVYHAYGYVKQAAAIVNTDAGRLAPWKGELIRQVAQEVIAGDLDDHFPLYVWQTGSGTQSNMNVNEVIANRCIQLVGGTLGSKHPVHPNDDVNMSQSTNDTFPTAMHIAAYELVTQRTIPAFERLRESCHTKAVLWNEVVKIGRTHLEDATPITVGQEWSGYVAALDDSIANLVQASDGLLRLAIGGTAVGTGVNAPPGFAGACAKVIAELTGHPYQSAPNLFAALATLDPLVRAHAALKSTAVTLFKVANDARWLGSGPRTGLGELLLPANEPGSSIMPGKVNPTQAEAMLMVCIQVMASDVAVAMGGAEGNFELNVFRPLVIKNYLHSALIMADACDRYREFLVDGLQLNTDQLRQNIDNSVMMVTALSPLIGYDKAAEISHDAIENSTTLRQAALAHGVDAELFDRVIRPIDLTRPGIPGEDPSAAPGHTPTG